MEYLIKLTVAWTLFLLLFELFYKNNGRFAANRIYLLLAVGLGLALPLIRLPSNAPDMIRNAQSFYSDAAVPLQQTAVPAGITSAGSIAADRSDPWSIMKLVYLAGIALLLIRSLVELAKIIRLKLRSPVRTIQGHKVIITGKIHAPYSFMGSIFIGDLSCHSVEELEYVIRHEAAHNTRRHWLDLWLMQLVGIVFWFHPLIWRYRYLLRMQHEYEADDMAANRDPYTYGHFLLQQTLLWGVPSLAHSFHFSPIKNRINMLTRQQGSGSWKYVLLIPALLGCTFLMAKAGRGDRPMADNETAFQGNVFSWRSSDTLYYDPGKKRPELATAKKKQIIFAMNDEPVYRNDILKEPVRYGKEAMDYIWYLQETFKAEAKKRTGEEVYLNVVNYVVDKAGRVVYYDIRYARPNSDLIQNQRPWEPFRKPEPVLDALVDEIIKAGPVQKPAKVDGKAVNAYVDYSWVGC